MLNKIAVVTVFLSLVSFPVLAQDKDLVPRTIPLSDDKPAPQKPLPTTVIQTAPTPAPAAQATPPLTATPPAHTPPPYIRYGSAGTALPFTSAGTGTLPFTSGGNNPQLQQQNEQNETKLNDTFDEIDTNHDGMINEAEFSIFYKTRADNPGFVKYDKNNDGQITRQEYEAGNTVGKKIVTPAEPPKLNQP